jgi:hypothetical protein
MNIARPVLLITLLSGLLTVQAAEEPSSGAVLGGSSALHGYDVNGDGVLDAAEADDSPSIRDRFKDLDSNSDGELDDAEFSRFEGSQSGEQDNPGGHGSPARIDPGAAPGRSESGTSSGPASSSGGSSGGAGGGGSR